MLSNRRRGWLWMGSVVVCIACAPTDEETSPDQGTLTVLSYNVHGLPDGVTRIEAPGVERMAQISPLLNAYDLVGLQEVFTDENHDVLVEGADHPVVEGFNAPLDSSRAYGAGLLTMAGTGALVASDGTYYEDCHGIVDGASDCLASKGIHALTVDLGEAKLTLLNTHHEAGGGVEDEAAREAQVAQVVALLDSLPSDHAVIYVGDFNMRASDPMDVAPLQAYADAGLRELCAELDCPEPDRIDKIYLRDSDTVQLTAEAWRVASEFVDDAGVPLSDHDAIAGELRWSRR